jgi:CelD/BcsL family acetyltransferase involved in cellulose biosynthesis
LSTPLVRADVLRETWAALFEWLGERTEGRVLRVEDLSTEGPVASAMRAVAAQMMLPVREQDPHARAFLSRHEAADVYLAHAISLKKRKEYRRQRSRLAEHGAVSWEHFDVTSDADAWADDFLRLERAGWKGREGSAIALHADQTAFVRAVVRSAATRGRLIAQRVRVDGTTIAIKLSLSATPTTQGVRGGFAFKIAYDEAHARYSPGVLLELDNLRYVLDASQLDWMDSCADPNHPMIDHLWRERRTISTALVGLSPLGRLGVPLLSAVRASYHALTRRTHDPVARDR